MTMAYDTLATKASLDKTMTALKQNGIDTFVVANGEAAKQKALELVPIGAEVMTMTSVTLNTIGLAETLNTSDQYNSVRTKLNAMNRETEGPAMQKLGAAPEWTVGSVHAVTEDGKVVIASNTGSQLPAYAYGASHVIWLVSTQKIVKDFDTALDRIYEYVLPLEAARADKAYGGGGSNVSKLLVVSKEVKANRITLIFIEELLGF